MRTYLFSVPGAVIAVRANDALDARLLMLQEARSEGIEVDFDQVHGEFAMDEDEETAVMVRGA